MFDIEQFNDHEECTICLEEFTDDDRVTPLPCDTRHYFHSKCIESWFKRHNWCPLCKVEFSSQQLKKVNNRLSMTNLRDMQVAELQQQDRQARPFSRQLSEDD